MGPTIGNLKEMGVDATVLLDSWRHLLHAIALNAFQVFQYLHVYDREANADTFADSELNALHQQLLYGVDALKNLNSDSAQINELRSVVRIFEIFLSDAYELCLKKWTAF